MSTLSAVEALRLFCTPRRNPASVYPVELLDSARLSTLRAGAHRIQVYRWGEGPPVLLAHGWSSQAARVASFAAPLAARGFQAVAFEARGHGRSSGRRSHLPAFHEAMRAVIAEVGPLHGALGHSLGAMSLALLSAWEPSLQPRRLVLVAGPEDLEFMLGGFAQASGVGPEVLAGMRRRLERRFGRPMGDYSVPAQAGGLTCSGLVVHDEDDEVVPVAHGQRIAAAWPGGRLLQTRGLGHSLLMHDPVVLEEAVGVLTSP